MNWFDLVEVTALVALMLLPFSLLGLLVCWHIARPQKAPADTSNRINKIRLIWFALTRENALAAHIPWLRKDELENVASGAAVGEADQQLRAAEEKFEVALSRSKAALAALHWQKNRP